MKAKSRGNQTRRWKIIVQQGEKNLFLKTAYF